MLSVLRVERWDSRRDGPVTESALRQKVQAGGYEVSSLAWQPGTILPAETQYRERIDAVVTGILRITLDGESAVLTAGDIVFVPRGSIRRVEVLGPCPVRCLDGVYHG
jgi:ethanolamine utilization protein EutQ (cupin superfamily)